MANNVRIIEVKQSVLKNNDKEAEQLRADLQTQGIFLLNLMSSPGSGKTSTLLQTCKRLAQKFNIAVMEADIDSSVDAAALAEAGVQSIQLHTGGMCHLDASMTRQGIDEVLTTLNAKPDLIVLENVGNLVCPAEFDTGAHVNVAILSTPEGDDKPLKYPLMFEICNLVLINKMDVAPYFDFSLERVKENIAFRNPHARVIPISAKTGKGIDEWCQWLESQVKKERL